MRGPVRQSRAPSSTTQRYRLVSHARVLRSSPRHVPCLGADQNQSLPRYGAFLGWVYKHGQGNSEDRDLLRAASSAVRVEAVQFSSCRIRCDLLFFFPTVWNVTATARTGVWLAKRGEKMSQ